MVESMRFDQLVRDLRYAVRTLRRNPGFTLTAVLSLALGIGANTAIFTVVNAVLLRPLPFPEPDRLVQLWETHPSKDDFRNVVNPLNFLDWRERTHSFTAMAAVEGGSANLTGFGNPLAVPAMEVSPSFFSILGISPVLGRWFVPEEGVPGRERVAILSFGLWQSRFAGDRSVVGRHILVDSEPYTIIGVMPRGFTLPGYTPEIWTPLPMVRSQVLDRGRYLSVIARVKPGITLRQAEQDLEQAARENAAERPNFDQGWSARAVPMLSDVTEHVRLPLLVLLVAVGLVLLIACANVANLLLMRAAGRMPEIAIRSALGASRRRLMRQLLLESFTLAVLACAAGIFAAYAGVQGLLALIPRQSVLPRIETIHIDARVLLVALAASLVSALIFGLAPSLQLSRTVPQDALRAGSVRTTAKSAMRQALVIAEIALSLILLAGAGLMLRSFERLRSVNPGFSTEHVLTMEMFVSPAKYLNDQKRSNYFAAIMDQIRAVPGVKAAGSAHFLPLQGQWSSSCFGRGDEAPPIPSTSPSADFLVISPGYFRTMNMPLVSGRRFDAGDRLGTRSVVLVNHEFVKRFLADRNPIGQTLNVCWSQEFKNPAEIVGVVGDARQKQLETAPHPTIFIDNVQSPMFFAHIVVRTAGDPMRMARAVERAVHRIDPDQPVTEIQTMDQVFFDSVAQPRLQLVLLLAFAGMAGLLAMVGIYGVVAYSVAQRTREIGIRVALGAQRADVSRSVLKEGAILAAAGIAIGLGGALALTRVLRSLLFETAPDDPATLAFVVVAILLVVLLATLLPARRAAQVDPITALRYE